MKGVPFKSNEFFFFTAKTAGGILSCHHFLCVLVEDLQYLSLSLFGAIPDKDHYSVEKKIVTQGLLAHALIPTHIDCLELVTKSILLLFWELECIC